MIEDQFLSHKNNILQKVRVADTENLALAKKVQARYEQFVASLIFPKDVAEEPIELTNVLNEYIDFIKEVEAGSSFFNWRSNFAASALPEFFYRCLVWRFEQCGITAFFSTKNSVIEATFGIDESGAMYVRHKDQDICVGVRRETFICGDQRIEFVPPAVSCEVKTNIDKNKLNGLDFSAERLKRSFPGAKYFLITETIDFSLQDNYAAGYIDEIFVLRKQVRSQARRIKAPICPDAVKSACDAIVDVVRRASHSAGHVYERLLGGKLIHSSETGTKVK